MDSPFPAHIFRVSCGSSNEAGSDTVILLLKNVIEKQRSQDLRDAPAIWLDGQAGRELIRASLPSRSLSILPVILRRKSQIGASVSFKTWSLFVLGGDWWLTAENLTKMP
jgi:hypothetical protein